VNGPSTAFRHSGEGRNPVALRHAVHQMDSGLRRNDKT